MCDGQCDCLSDDGGICADETDCTEFYSKIDGKQLEGICLGGGGLDVIVFATIVCDSYMFFFFSLMIFYYPDKYEIGYP